MALEILATCSFQERLESQKPILANLGRKPVAPVPKLFTKNPLHQKKVKVEQTLEKKRTKIAPLPSDLISKAKVNNVDGSKTVFKCPFEECSREFNHKRNLVDHFRGHHQETKPHACPYPNCSKSFLRPAHLLIHQRIHTGEKPYACEYPGCGKKWNQKSALKQHMRSHTGEKPFACSVPGCNKKFSTSSSCKRHVLTHERNSSSSSSSASSSPFSSPSSPVSSSYSSSCSSSPTLSPIRVDIKEEEEAIHGFNQLYQCLQQSGDLTKIETPSSPPEQKMTLSFIVN